MAPSNRQPAARSNVSLLTEGSKYFQRAKKSREDRVEKIVFDDDARREWLTGFHKRKKAKTDERRAKAKARDHQEHLEERRKARQELKQRALENVKSVRKAMGLDDLSDTENPMLSTEMRDGSPILREQEEEFSDDEQAAVVTIVEDFDPSQHASGSRLGGEGQEKSMQKIITKPAVPLLPASSRKQQKKAASALSAAEKLAAKRKQRREHDSSFETKSERRKGRELEFKKRARKAEEGRERDGGGGGRGGRGGGRGGGAKRGGRGGGRGGRGGRGGKK